MKTFKTIIAVFGLVLMFNACGPNLEEEVKPSTINEDMEQFKVQNTEGDNGGKIISNNSDD